MRWLLLFLLVPEMLPAPPCRYVDRDRLVAADLAADVPAFRQLDPELFIGPAPGPGTHRTFLSRELSALAAKNGVQLSGAAPELCFERALRPLTMARIRDVMQTALGTDDVRIDILDYSRQPMPSGDLVFPRAGLTLPRVTGADATALWRGLVKYSSQNTLPVWASVRLHQQRSIVVAVRGIRCGAAIAPADVALVSRDVFPFTPHLEVLTQAVGRVARKTIPAGALITGEVIEVPPDVEVGDTVHVVVTNGSARISFDAIARSQGRKGERILLLNPESHRTFRALLDDKAQAHIGGGA